MRKLRLAVLTATLAGLALTGPAIAQRIDYDYDHVRIFYGDGGREVGREVYYCDGSFTMTGYATENFRYYNGFCP